jgi:hypothetical protein
MAEQYTRKTIGTGKFWLEEGWYTVKQLEDLLTVNKRMNEQLNKSMEQVSGHLKKIRKRNE